jgi:hypothetical protein
MADWLAAGMDAESAGQWLQGSSSEHDEQVLVVDWARRQAAAYPELALLHSSVNGAKLPYVRGKNNRRFSPQAIKLKQEGLLPGVSDLFLPVARLGYHGLYIEMKRKGGELSEDQEWFLRAVHEQGYAGIVSCGGWEAIEALQVYLGIIRGRDLDFKPTRLPRRCGCRTTGGVGRSVAKRNKTDANRKRD